MKKLISKKAINGFRLGLAGMLLVTLSISFFSFTVNKLTGDFLQQLGLSKANADEKIISSLLGGYVDTYGLTNVKNIALGNRTAVTNDLLVYIKQYAGSAAFKKEYTALKERNKPTLSTVQTPEAFKKEAIDQLKKAVSEMEGYYKNADAYLKPIFEK